MRHRSFWLLVILASLSAVLSADLFAAKPWELLIPFKRVEADPEQSYELSEAHGPWMIMATSFAGPNAEQQAKELVIELRSSMNLPAYTFKRKYDFTKPVVGLGLNRYGGPKVMRYANPVSYEEIAVLVGDFASVDDPKLDKTLDKIRHAHPECLDLTRNKNSTQRFIGLRELHRRLTSDPEKKKRGPMGHAFVTRNPLLPEEYFVSKGPDALVVEMNRDVEYSLLKNEGNFTVRVATFRGASTMDQELIATNSASLESKLEQAALNAHKLTVALRRKGVEAYEFHDRYESMVTIGSFDSVGTPRADGKTELNPAIYRIMEQYKATERPLPGGRGVGMVPKDLEGIPFDVQPIPVKVPKVSIAAAYSPRNLLFR